MVSEDRLTRIENKVDKLVEAMSSLIRFEEKMAHVISKGERLEFRADDIEDRVEAIEKKMPLINLMLSATGKVSIAVLTLVACGIVASFFVF